MRKIAVRVAIVLAVLWVAASAGLSWAMHQPVERFGRIMSKTPMAAFMVLPFETLWTRARAGQLDAGEAAPDFTLPTLDHKEQVRLASLRGKPVVLVFGSYT